MELSPLTVFALVINVLAAASVIVLVLLQHGKGADMGAAFGSGSAGSLFGSAGSANFLSRMTAVSATVFFASALALVMLTSPAKSELGVMKDLKQGSITVPAAPASAPKGEISN
ncbi:preprotein translocase subunit SecG [Chitinilyticum piscinae]|uniref:Protein-export membrane protein SecG n=1 Tax=Chitinilyticum piscinae TaxID=2866724 RepID=A0A8J7K9P7_9NEIS|nr:preprotein translocase subunit SecG [Chitinilyticum piscinae]MBE9608479.1 preprotein translocase subunit SecG [Chitinilyticum piscinae]